MGMLDREMYCGLLRIRTEKLALKLGSSKQGNAVRALVGSKWVEAKVLKKKDTTINTGVIAACFSKWILEQWWSVSLTSSLPCWFCMCSYKNHGGLLQVLPQTQCRESSSGHCWAPWERRYQSAHGKGYEELEEPGTGTDNHYLG